MVRAAVEVPVLRRTTPQRGAGDLIRHVLPRLMRGPPAAPVPMVTHLTESEVLFRERRCEEKEPPGLAKARRAQRRQTTLVSAHALPGRTMLETAGIGAATRRAYLHLLGRLAMFMGMPGRPSITATECVARTAEIVRKFRQAKDLDDLVAQYLDDHFFSGGDGAQGSRLLAALTWAVPDLARGPCLPRARQAAVALRRLAPPKSRLPIPESLLYAVAEWLMKRDLAQTGLAVLLAHHAYLRPAELARITWSDISPPPSHSSKEAVVVLTLHPLEKGISSKGREFDECVDIDLAWLARLLEKLKARRPPSELLLPGGHVKLAKLLAEAGEALLVSKAIGKLTPHRLRHSGPSADWQSGARSLPVMQLRGRWQAASSLKRYQKGGRINELLASCSPQLRRDAARAMRDLPGALEKLLAGGGARRRRDS